MSWVPGFRPSNGTMGDIFQLGPMGCFSCSVDHDQGWHDGQDGGESCPILMRSIIGEPTPEWEEHNETRETRCTGWRGPCACTEGTTYEPPPPEWLSQPIRHSAEETA